MTARCARVWGIPHASRVLIPRVISRGNRLLLALSALSGTVFVSLGLFRDCI